MKTCENCGESQPYHWFEGSGIRDVCEECWCLEFKNNKEARDSYLNDYDVNEYR